MSIRRPRPRLGLFGPLALAAGLFACEAGVPPGNSPTPSSESNCVDGEDNDSDGLIDCRDADCANASTCHEAQCVDGEDNDGDGDTDCEDVDCGDAAACQESDCDDGVDDDGDGLTDCADVDCELIGHCAENCADGSDGDSDGHVDCADSDCTGRPECSAPEGMVRIHGGVFEMGHPKKLYGAGPTHEVDVPAFLIDRDIVSLNAYRECVMADACNVPVSYLEDDSCVHGPQPAEGTGVNCFTWKDAKSYCAWRGKRLCSEAELEKSITWGLWVRPWESSGIYGKADRRIILEDCYFDSYGMIHPNGTLEIWAPTDGSAWVEAGCPDRLEVSDDGSWIRSRAPASGTLSQFTAIRCCAAPE